VSCLGLYGDRGWKVAHEYVDNNVSATARVVRPEYEQLLEDIESGQIDAVVVYDLDRLTRRPIELEGFVNTCALAGVTQLVFVGGGVDMGTGDGLLVARIKGAFAAEESRKLSERMKRKKLETAERGMLLGGGRRPLGFQSDRFTHNTTEVALVREAADRILAGEGLLQIVRDWQARGIHSTTGGTWTSTCLRTALSNPRTAGLQVHRGKVIGKAAWEEILDRQTWDRVMFVLRGSGRQRWPRQVHPLNGIMRCGACGGSMGSCIKPATVGHRHVYQCMKRSGGCRGVSVNGQPLEEYVFGLMMAMADNTDVRKAVASELAGDQAALAKLEAQISKDEQSLRHLDDRFGAKRIPRGAWLIQRRDLEARIVERTNEHADRRGWSAVDKLAGDWESTSTEEKAFVAESLIKSIRVFPIGTANKFNPHRLVIDWRTDGVLADFLLSDRPSAARS
jgi:DNA invertase Pin-like site-specific DNA recombinase